MIINPTDVPFCINGVTITGRQLAADRPGMTSESAARWLRTVANPSMSLEDLVAAGRQWRARA